MTLKITRVEPGLYTTTIHDEEYRITQVRNKWFASTGPIGSKPKAEGSTKREIISRLETLARATKDRIKSDAHKIPGRKVLTPGTELTLVKGALRGASGRVRFIGYTKTSGEREWLDVVDSKGRSRAVDPSKVKTVHRDRKMF